jgi:hypothetical protein
VYSYNGQIVVVIPEVPGFAGDIKSESGIKTIMAAQYRTINRGGQSIHEEVKKAGYDPYVFCCSPWNAYDIYITEPITFVSTIFVAMTVSMLPIVRTS